jgi:hypothetical protein
MNPNEKEWYEGKEYLETFAGGIGSERRSRPNIPKIVAEAERRGREAAWEEAKEIANDLTPFHITREYRDTDAMRDQLVSVFNAKLTELKKV